MVVVVVVEEEVDSMSSAKDTDGRGGRGKDPYGWVGSWRAALPSSP